MKFLKECIPYILILLVVVFIRSFIITPVIVDGSSMDDTLQDDDVLILKKYDKSYDRFDIVVFNYGNQKLIKRVIGLPGETVEYKDGILYIDGEEMGDKFSSITYDFNFDKLELDFIPEGYYFVLGDNRNNSLDSRIIGLINEDDINGITDFSLWPFKSIE